MSVDERPREAPTPPKRNLPLLFASTAVALALPAWALVRPEGCEYARSVDRLVAEGGAAVGRPVRVQGRLVDGSPRAEAGHSCGAYLRLMGWERELLVHYVNCPLPLPLQHVAEAPSCKFSVTAAGELGADGVFDAFELSVRSASRFDSDDPCAAFWLRLVEGDLRQP
jgi:hypothetical protein